MSLCIHKLINDAFTIYKFQKLIVGTNKKNLRSQKFIEKNGFELEKTTQNHFYYQLQNI
jgi:RimJ/RimL family protein N-acetyltransferase